MAFEYIKIRITLFYSSNRVFNLAYSGNRILPDMIIWANDFFRIHGFELDTYPIPFDSNIYRNLFILIDDANELKIDYKEAEIKRINELIEENEKQVFKNIFNKLNQEKSTLYDYKRTTANLLRGLAHLKYRDDFPIKKPARLPIILAESTDNSYVLGETFSNIGEWMPFILIYINRAVKHTIAHEIFHAAGFNHSKREGFNDGPSDDLMNYNSQGLLPSQTKISEINIQRLKSAYFVL